MGVPFSGPFGHWVSDVGQQDHLFADTDSWRRWQLDRRDGCVRQKEGSDTLMHPYCHQPDSPIKLPLPLVSFIINNLNIDYVTKLISYDSSFYGDKLDLSNWQPGLLSHNDTAIISAWESRLIETFISEVTQLSKPLSGLTDFFFVKWFILVSNNICSVNCQFITTKLQHINL